MLLNRLKQYFYLFLSFFGLSRNHDKIENISEETIVNHINENCGDECLDDIIEKNPSISFNHINWDLIHKIHKGDIIYVKMESEVILKNNISQYHQLRPFVVVRKD